MTFLKSWAGKARTSFSTLGPLKGGDDSVPVLGCHCLSVEQTEEQGTQAGDAGTQSQRQNQSSSLWSLSLLLEPNPGTKTLL